MERYTRAEIKSDEVLNKLLQLILSKHITPMHTVKNLMDLRHVPDICEETVMFAELPAEGEHKAIYISYEFSTWVDTTSDPNQIKFPTRVDAITLYEHFVEYETTRVKQLSNASREDSNSGPDVLNLN